MTLTGLVPCEVRPEEIVLLQSVSSHSVMCHSELCSEKEGRTKQNKTRTHSADAPTWSIQW